MPGDGNSGKKRHGRTPAAGGIEDEGCRFALRRSAAALMMVLLVSGCAGLQQRKASNNLFKPQAKLLASSKPLPEAGPPPASLEPTGSLWSPSEPSLFADIKAAKVGDLLTITISENASGSNTATTTADKAKTFAGNLSFSGVGVGASGVAHPKGLLSFGPYNGSFSSTFKGDGSTSRSDTVTAYMTATVVNVLPNGNLVIRGSRWTKVNDELEQIVLEGVVRPTDIGRNNTVLSQDVAEAKIFMIGKGPVSQHQKPGWLGQLWDFISPF